MNNKKEQDPCQNGGPGWSVITNNFWPQENNTFLFFSQIFLKQFVSFDDNQQKPNLKYTIQHLLKKCCRSVH